MKYKKYAFIAIMLVVAIIGVISFSQKPNQPSEQLQANQFAQVQQALAKGALLIDVRTPDEYAAGHIAGAENLSLQAIQSGAMPNGDTNKKIYVYCRSGHRAAQAAILLQKAGYAVDNLGGMDGVVAMGGTVVK